MALIDTPLETQRHTQILGKLFYSLRMSLQKKIVLVIGGTGAQGLAVVKGSIFLFNDGEIMTDIVSSSRAGRQVRYSSYY